MDTRTELITEIEAFVLRTGLAETTLGGRAVKDSRFVSRLRAGLGVELKSIERVRAFMREYQPPTPAPRAQRTQQEGRAA